MSDILCDKVDCTGCLACVSFCPKGAIDIYTDFMGFSYPKVDTKKCVSCGLCEKNCHICNPPKGILIKEESTHKYKATDAVRNECASGGFVSLITQYCYEKGYYICGVTFTNDYLGAEYVVTRSWEVIGEMRKSKYVEARTNNIFHDVKKLISAGEKVLFVGLPCHVAALKKVVPISENLITVDILCHGNGSPKYYKNGLISLCEKHGINVADIEKVDFRPKPEELGKKSLEIRYNGKSLRVSSDQFPYYYGYVERLVLRDSCYDCKYSGTNRIGDISCGDFVPCTSDMGESLVIANSERGRLFLDELKRVGDFTQLTTEEYDVTKGRFVKRNVPKLRKNVVKTKNYEKLQKTFLCSEYVPIKYKIKRKIKKLLGRK